MKLLTLGGLRVDGASYRREKPLLLLAYLLLEGPQPRRRLADLFWPDAANPMNSLAQNLIRLRPLGAITETDQRVEAHLPCDAADFRAHHRAARWTEACDTYTGEFLEGLRLDLTPDLEEWLLDTRDTLASEARAAHLTLAEHHHARAEPTPAHAHAERAYRTPGAPPCPPEDLTRLWHLLGSTDHPLTLHLRRDADDLGLRLPTPTPPTPDHTLIGRHDELSTLTGLPTGSVAWISGPPGIGKTTLLRALTRHGWRLLSARGGLPLATLEPLSPHPLSSTADALNLLRDTRLKLAIDDWEDCDDTTRAALTLAARQTPGATIAITARHPPTIPTPHHLPLHSLTEHDLQGHPGAHAATGGHPTLLSAYLNGTPPDRTLDAHLRHLGDDHRRLFLALAAQDTPNLGATRAALNLSAATLASTLDTLTREGLTTPDGSIRASTPARHLLDTHPLDTTLTHLHLARHHPRDTAWPHWLAARDLWEDHDHTPCAAAAHWHADQEMKRGYPARAARTLEVAPQTDEVKLLRGWVLVKAGDSVNAEHWLNNIGQGVSGSWALMSVMAMCKFRLGRLDECRDLAEKIPMNLGIWSAHAAYALASYHLRIGNYEKSLDWYYNSRDLYYSSGEISSAIQCGGMISTLICKKGEDPRLAFADVLVDSENVLLERASILVNYADCLSEYLGYHDFEQFESIYKEAIQIFRQNENSDGEASALNSCGVCAHFGERFEYALKYYKMALKCVESTGNIRLLGIISANLAEVMGDADRIKGVIDFLSRSGHGEIAEQIGNNLL